MGSNSSQRSNRDYKKPVAWLLGRQLISSLKGTLLYTAFGSKLDPRDWMQAQEYPSADQEQAEKSWQEQANKLWKGTGGGYWKKKGEFWFDYIADTGDGMRPTYSIAYLCLSSLWVEGSLRHHQQNFPAQHPNVGFIVRPDFSPQDPSKYSNKNLNREQDKLDEKDQTLLPRGEFLLVGGDTTYHLSDYEGLHKRFQIPFRWAFDDLRRDGRLWKEKNVSWDDLRRPLFGIPGNHDYYDQLDGFRRQFLQPIREDRNPPPGRPFDAPQLMIRGFVRRQLGSYIALRLPFDWLLWGLDTEVGKIDERQRKFFRSITVKTSPNAEAVGESEKLCVENGVTPDKLIVATCAPSTVFGKYADKDDEKSAKAFLQLGLPRPFLDPQNLKEEDGTTELEKGQCRLDLSGDVHLYARYWGPDSKQTPRGQSEKKRKKESDHYASVVSGLGGAFHHPSTTYAGEISEQVLYPSVQDSRREVARRIFYPWNIIRGGGVWALGLFLAFLIYFAATLAQSSRQGINPYMVWAGITTEERASSTVATDQPLIKLPRLLSFLIFSDKTGDCANSQSSNTVVRIINTPPEVGRGVVFSAISLVLIGLVFWPTERIYKKYRKQEEVSMKASEWITDEDEQELQEEEDGIVPNHPVEEMSTTPLGHLNTVRGKFDEREQSVAWYGKLMSQFMFLVYPLVALSVIMLGLGILSLQPRGRSISPFSSSMMVLLMLSWAVAAVILSVRYSDWVSKMVSRITIKIRHKLLAWFLSLSAILSVICGFAIFGRNNTASYMLTDILLAFSIIAVILGLMLLGAFKFGEVIEGPMRLAHCLLGILLGLFHALLQLTIPFLLVRKGTWQAWAMVLILLPIMQVVGWWLMKGNYYKLLLAAWLIFGSVMLLLPYLAFYISPPPDLRPCPFFASFQAYSGIVAFYTGVSDWGKLLACFIAGGVGFLMSCIWLNWYLAIALLYHGHNNEAGGAARIEKFKQFIRFRLTDNDLTGFVIAIKEPRESGTDLRPEIIDVIHLTRRP